jgi:hypothetical protein
LEKTLLYRLFGTGKIPPPLMAQLKDEAIFLLDEGIPGTATYSDFRAPGKYMSWRRTGFTGALALTGTRILALAYSNRIIDVPLDDKRLGGMKYSLEGGPTLCVAFDAGLFHSDWSGRIEYRFRTVQAQNFMTRLTGQVS